LAWLTYKIIDEIADKNSIGDLKKKLKLNNYSLVPYFFSLLKN
jgi:hypothetical protein